MLSIIAKRKYYYTFSLACVVTAVVFLIIWGFKMGIDFTGGSLMEVSFQETARPSVQEISGALTDLSNLGEVTIQPIGENNIILRFRNVTEIEHQEVLDKLIEQFTPGQRLDIKTTTTPVQIEGLVSGEANVTGIKAEKAAGARIIEERFDSIGPTVGQELKTKSFYAVIIVIIAIIAFIAWSFRKVGRPVSSWKYGVTAIIALVHDVTITCGIFALLGHFYNVEINTPFIAALLTVLGYSVNDTIVVFDRIRENLHRHQGDFEEIVNMSVNQTMIRSVNTSLTVMLTLLAIFLFGGETIRYFALTLMVGVFFGTYSSIFVASSLLVTWQNLVKKFAK
ncbi:MAG: protein translocase subunit SecF [Patescibacteria group bacterium]